MSGTRHETQPVATIIYDNGSELTGTAVTTSDGSVGIRIPNEFFKTGLLPDGSMPEGVKSVSIRPKHPKGVLPLTDDMVYMAVTASLRDAVGLPIANTEHISSRMRPLSFFDAFMYSSLNLRVTCRFVAMLILSSIRQAKQDRYRSRSFPMRHHYALRAQKT